jgi:hypothetical protein
MQDQMDCGSLEILHAIKNIPRVEIQSCPRITNFSGLGHKLIHVRKTTIFKNIVEEYRKDPTTHQNILGNVAELYYSDETRKIELGLSNIESIQFV